MLTSVSWSHSYRNSASDRSAKSACSRSSSSWGIALTYGLMNRTNPEEADARHGSGLCAASFRKYCSAGVLIAMTARRRSVEETGSVLQHHTVISSHTNDTLIPCQR